MEVNTDTHKHDFEFLSMDANGASTYRCDCGLFRHRGKVGTLDQLGLKFEEEG